MWPGIGDLALTEMWLGTDTDQHSIYELVSIGYEFINIFFVKVADTMVVLAYSIQLY